MNGRKSALELTNDLENAKTRLENERSQLLKLITQHINNVNDLLTVAASKHITIELSPLSNYVNQIRDAYVKHETFSQSQLQSLFKDCVDSLPNPPKELASPVEELMKNITAMFSNLGQQIKTNNEMSQIETTLANLAKTSPASTSSKIMQDLSASSTQQKEEDKIDIDKEFADINKMLGESEKVTILKKAATTTDEIYGSLSAIRRPPAETIYGSASAILPPQPAAVATSTDASTANPQIESSEAFTSLDKERKLILSIMLHPLTPITNNDIDIDIDIEDYKQRITKAANTNQSSDNIRAIYNEIDEKLMTKEFRSSIKSLCETQDKILALENNAAIDGDHAEEDMELDDAPKAPALPDDDVNSVHTLVGKVPVAPQDDTEEESLTDEPEPFIAAAKKPTPKKDKREDFQEAFQGLLDRLNHYREALQTIINNQRTFGYHPDHAARAKLMETIDQRIHLLTNASNSQTIINDLPEILKTIGEGIANPNAKYRHIFHDQAKMKDIRENDRKTWEAIKLDYARYCIKDHLEIGAGALQHHLRKYAPVHHADHSELIPIKENQTPQAAYQEHKKNPPKQEALDAMISDQSTQLKEKAKATEGRVCTVGKMAYIQTSNQGSVQSAVCDAPDTFSNRKIWDNISKQLFQSDSLEAQTAREKYGIHRPDLITNDALDSIWKALHKQMTFNPAETIAKKIEYVIANEFKRLGFKHAINNPTQTAAFLADTFVKEYSNNLQPTFTRAFRFANDDIIRLVMSQVQLLLAENPKATIHVKNTPNAQYLDTMYLYAKSKGIPIINHTDYANFPAPSTKKLEAFESLLKDRKLELPNLTRGYNDLEQTHQQLVNAAHRNHM